MKNPFPPESDEVTVAPTPAPQPDKLTPTVEPTPVDEKQPQPTAAASPSPAPTGTPNADAAKKNVPAAAPETIDFDGITSRVTRVPLPAENYGGLTAKTGHLLYFVGSAFYYGRQSDRPTSLRIFSVKDRKETTLMDGVGTYFALVGRLEIIVGGGGGFFVMDAAPQGANGKKAVSTAGMTTEINPSEEWNQISAKSGGVTAIGFMCRICTVSTGRNS